MGKAYIFRCLDPTNLTHLSIRSNRTNLTSHQLSGSLISDITALASLTSLTVLDLEGNRISDIAPLLQNSGLGRGDQLRLGNNNLDLAEGSEDLANIRRLEGRGVSVFR